jgi:hypothetical protein
MVCCASLLLHELFSHTPEGVQQQLVGCGGLDKLLRIFDAPNPDPELQSVVGSILVMLTAFDCKYMKRSSSAKGLTNCNQASIRTALLKSDILSPLNRYLMASHLPDVQKKSVLLLYNLLLDEANEQAVIEAGTVLLCAQLLGPTLPRDLVKESLALFAPFSQNGTVSLTVLSKSRFKLFAVQRNSGASFASVVVYPVSDLF